MTPMTHTRRATVALAAATLVLTLAACGSQDGPEVADGSVAEEKPAVETGDTGGSVEQGESGGDGSGDVEAARAGLARYLEANRPESPTTSTNIPGCPVLEVSVLEEQLAAVGFADTTLEGWATEIEWNEYEDISPDLMGVACGGDSDGNPNDSDFGTAGGMVAVDLAGHSDFPTFLGAMGLATEGEETGDTVTICPEAGYCVALWHSDGLVVGAALMADGADEESTGTLLDAVLPDALATLAEN